MLQRLLSRSGTFLVLLIAMSSVAPIRAQTKDLYDDTVVRRVDLIFNTPGYWSQLQQNYASKTYMKADLRVDGVLYKDVGVRFRGNSSYFALPSSSLKRPFKISIDEYVPDRKLQKYKTLNFNNNWQDPAFVREILAYSIFRKFLPAPKSCYIHLYINGESWGPYFNTQQVNKAMLKEWFESNDGNRYRGERDNLTRNIHYSALSWLGSAATPYQSGYELKLKNAPNPWVDIIEACNVLNNTPATSLYTELPKVLDVDSAIWMHANANVLVWLDSYIGRWCHNFYVNQDLAHGRLVFTPWDTNGSFGGYPDNLSRTDNLSPFYQENHASRPLFTRVIKNAKWRQRYLAHIRSILDTEFEWSKIEPRLSRYRTMVEPLVRADGKALYTHQQFIANLTQSLRVRMSWTWRTIPGLEPFIKARTASLRNHAEVRRIAPRVTNLSRSVARPTLRDDVFITARVDSSVAVGGATLYFRVRGPYTEVTMLDDGKNGDGQAGDGVYGAKIPKQIGGTKVEYYVSARSTSAQQEAMTFLPRTASNRPPNYVVGYPTAVGAVRINEVLAKNTNGLKDEAGENEDWLELTNSSPTGVDVGGMYLTDEFHNPKKWQIPAGTTIPGGGRILVWCDEDQQDGPLHANFKLSSSEGEWIGLFQRDGETLSDQLRFGPQFADVSAGRLLDGGAPWVTFPAPTPGQSNEIACGAGRYDAFTPELHRFRLSLLGVPSIGATPNLVLANGPTSGSVLMFLGASGGHLSLGADIVLLLGGPALVGPYPIPTSSSGAFSVGLPIPNNPALVGSQAFVQVAGTDSIGDSASNAVQISVCR